MSVLHYSEPVRGRSRHRRQSSLGPAIGFLRTEFVLFALLVLLLPGNLGADAQFSPLYRAVIYLTYVPVIVMLIRAGSGRETALGGSGSGGSGRFIVMLMVAMTAFMTVIGLVKAPSLSLVIPLFLVEGLPMFAVALLLFGRSIAENQRAFGRLVATQSLIAGLITMWVLVRYPITESRDESLNVSHEMAFGLLSSSTVAVLMLPSLTKRQRAASLFGYLCTVALSFAYQGRLQTLLYAGVVPLGWMFVQMRLGAFATSVRRVVGPVMAMGVVAAAAIVFSPAARTQLEIGLDQTVHRFTKTRSLVDVPTSSDEPEARWIEAAEFLRASSWTTWLIGEGVGGTWRSEYMGSGMKDSMWGMVHFGPLHLVLKGGVALLVLFHALYALVLFRLWRQSAKSRLAGAVFVYALVMYAGFLSHGPIRHTYATYFTWTVFGVAFTVNHKGGQADCSLGRGK